MKSRSEETVGEKLARCFAEGLDGLDIFSICCVVRDEKTRDAVMHIVFNGEHYVMWGISHDKEITGPFNSVRITELIYHNGKPLFAAETNGVEAVYYGEEKVSSDYDGLIMGLKITSAKRMEFSIYARAPSSSLPRTINRPLVAE